MKLSDIADLQPKAWKLLARSYQSGRVASTYLFSGREGLGHWQLGLSFAALLNCKHTHGAEGESSIPCGECDSCRLIASLNSPSLHAILPIPSHKDLKEAIDLTNEVLELKRKEPFSLITAPSQLTVPIDMAREVKRRLSLRGEAGTTRVVIFYQMDKMLTASADALLKLIEEPPLDTVIILTADQPETLLPTIRSRAQLIRLDRVSEQGIASYLATHYDVPREKGLLYARVTDGNLGRAVELAVDEDAEEVSQRAVGFLAFKALFVAAPPEAVSVAVEFSQGAGRSQIEDLLRLWGSLVRDCAQYAATGEEEHIINRDYSADIIKLSGRFSDPCLAPAMTVALKNALADIRRNVHIQTSMAALALRLGAAIRAAH